MDIVVVFEKAYGDILGWLIEALFENGAFVSAKHENINALTFLNIA
jgi:hypothetical protein